MINKQERMREFQKKMRKSLRKAYPEDPLLQDDVVCLGCECYEPFFKYRKCLYPSCRYNRVENVFRERPLAEDILATRAKDELRKPRGLSQSPNNIE